MRKKSLRKIIRHFFDNKTNKTLSIIFVFALVLFFTLIKSAIIILLLILAAWLIKFYQKYIDIQFGFDLTMMVTVLTSFAYNPWIGVFTGISSLFLATTWGGRFTPSVFFGAFLLIIIAFLVPGLRGLGITNIGILIAIVYDAVQLFAYMNVFGGRIERGLIFMGTHLIFNFWAFIVIAPKLLSFM